MPHPSYCFVRQSDKSVLVYFFSLDYSSGPVCWSWLGAGAGRPWRRICCITKCSNLLKLLQGILWKIKRQLSKRALFYFSLCRVFTLAWLCLWGGGDWTGIIVSICRACHNLQSFFSFKLLRKLSDEKDLWKCCMLHNKIVGGGKT